MKLSLFLLRCCASLCFTVALTAPAFAQITITATDAGAWMAVGTTETTSYDSTRSTADIGAPGATSWDFSTLVTNSTYSSTWVLPAATPAIGYFPGSTNASESITNTDADTSYNYGYYKLGTDLLFSGAVAWSMGALQARIWFVPELVADHFPLTLGTSWTTTSVESTMIVLPPPLSGEFLGASNIKLTNTVDAYGALTLPGGGTYQALRIRSDYRQTDSTDTVGAEVISYTILASNGDAITFSALDTLQSNSGTINIDGGIGWRHLVPGGTTAISLVTLSAQTEAGHVRISWYAPGDEIAQASVYRRTAESDWTLVGHPVPDQNRNILFEDDTVTPGLTYGYRLVVRDVTAQESSIETWVDVPEGTGAPKVVRLGPSYPNPFGLRTQFTYGLPKAGPVRLVVYDLQGRQVATVVNEVQAAGWRSVLWDGREVASGIYFARLESGDEVSTRKIVIAR